MNELENTRGEWLQRIAVANYGAMLVRPDNFFVRRAPKLIKRPEEALKEAVDRVLERRSSSESRYHGW
jgi:hypothetical protein